VLSGRGLCDELITRPEESYRLCCVVVCDLETSRIGAQYIQNVRLLRVKGSLDQWRIFHWTTDQLFENVFWSHLERSILHWTTDQLFEPCSDLELLRQQASSATVGDGTSITTSSTHLQPQMSAEYSTIKYTICVGFLEYCRSQAPVFDLSHRTTCVSTKLRRVACTR